MNLPANNKYIYWITIFVISLFLVQTHLVFVISGNELEIYVNPAILFVVSLVIPSCYLFLLFQNPTSKESLPVKKLQNILFFMAGAATILISYEEVRKLFAHYPDVGKLSDVLPCIEIQYHRFAHHEYPYTPIKFDTYTLNPIYLPLQWVPVGITQFLGIDDRWIGFIFLTIAAGIFGIFVLRNTKNYVSGFIALILVSVPFWAFIKLGGIEIPATLETEIAAYYLVLAAGLAMRNLPVIIAGIILCLLSRYTFVFWVPLFAVLLWQNVPVKRSIFAWSIVALAVLVIYVLPFYIKDPKTFTDGLAYYNNQSIGSWAPFHDDPYPYTFSNGLNFGPYMWHWLPGDIPQKVFLSRLIQVGWMLALLFGGIWYYRKHKAKLNFYDFSLVMLYLFITFFFMFTAQLFKYYLLTWLVLSGVLCAKIVLMVDTLAKKSTITDHD